MSERTDIETLRARLEGSRGRDYWRSLDELSGTPEFKAFVHREFPERASEWLDPVGRRNFLKLMGASLALAGIGACTRQPDEAIVPYVRQPEEVIPGKPLYYATAMPFAGAGIGLLVETHQGRPTKIEGNPQHPVNQGATDAFAQAAILGLYDPDRSQTLTHLGDVRSFDAFAQAVRGILAGQVVSGGAGICILTETVASPTLAAQLEAFLAQYPQARWVQWEPYGRHNAREGSRLAFGEYVEPQYDLALADVVLSLDADFLCTGPQGLRHARAFASRRRIEGDRAALNRLYAVESTPTNTGTKADHRLPVRASDIEAFARAVAARLGVAAPAPDGPAGTDAWLTALVRDLEAARGRSLVIAGDAQPPAVHALAHAINSALGNVGATVTYTPTSEIRPSDQRAGLQQLVADMNAGTVGFLLVLGGNPVYTAPADLEFAAAMDRVPVRAHLGLQYDETAALCHWHIPEAHFLESWGDVRAADGTVSIIQPLIAPLYNGYSVHEVAGVLNGPVRRPGYEIVRAYWRGEGVRLPMGEDEVVDEAEAPLAAQGPRTEAEFERDWRRWLHDGFIAGTAFAPQSMVAQADAAGAPPAPRPAGGVDVVFRPDSTIWDGRFANNGWLQELPKALTTLTWDNAALIAPGTAERLLLVSGDVVELRQGDRTLRIPVWLAPGHALDTLTLHAGYGRTRAGRVGSGTGVNVTPLRTMGGLDILAGVEVEKTGDRQDLAATQTHWSLEGRNIVRVGTVAQFQQDPGFADRMENLPIHGESMYPEYRYDGYAWGMAIDQNTCTGCNACVVACQAENNIPVVGKSQVLNHREMHWLRVDRYYTGDVDDPDTYHQPMLCQHCEKAPCEVVCPVAATVHSDEGLNEMVYNRCVGTRYCSNNCPYKVRRFNYLLYADWNTPSLKLMRNPDVTVRSRGVIEKCTYCVQRINEARINAKLEDRRIADGEVVTACQSVCPTDAIVFGDINDPGSRVSRMKASPLNYPLLAELNTRPRTTYLAIVRNPNPELEPAEPPAAAHGGDTSGTIRAREV